MAMSANPGSPEGEPPNDASPLAGHPTGTGPEHTAEHTAGDAPQHAGDRTAELDTATAAESDAPEVVGQEAVWDVLEDQPELLACGRQLDALWEAWTDDPDALAADPHVASCPHCATALSELRLLDEFVREEMRHERRTAARTSAAHTGRITDRVMDIVRTELRPGASVPLGAPHEDHWITETAAARTFRAAAEREPGVAAGSCRIAPADGEERHFVLPGARLPRVPLRVRIGIIAPLRERTPVPRIADAVRGRVTVAADRELGMEVTVVDVVVVDVTVEETGEPEEEARDEPAKP